VKNYETEELLHTAIMQSMDQWMEDGVDGGKPLAGRTGWPS